MALKEAVEMAKKGLSYAKRTKYKEALAYYNKAITLDPNYAEGLFLRAAALIESGRYKEGLLDCDKAIAINQNLSEAWSKKALALFYLERIEDALAASTRASTLTYAPPSLATFSVSAGRPSSVNWPSAHASTIAIRAWSRHGNLIITGSTTVLPTSRPCNAGFARTGALVMISAAQSPLRSGMLAYARSSSSLTVAA